MREAFPWPAGPPAGTAANGSRPAASPAGRNGPVHPGRCLAALPAWPGPDARSD